MAAGDVKLWTADYSKSKYAIVGDGTADYVQIDAWGVAREAAGTADTVGTLMGWIFRETTANDDCIISAGDTNAVEYLSLHVHNGYLNCSLADGGAAAFDIEGDNLDVPIGAWYHCAVVQDGVQPILYVNGLAIAASNDVSTDITKWFADLDGIDNANIGALDQNTSVTMDIDGAIADVRHYNFALSAAEIASIYAGGEARNDHPMISHWDFEDDLIDNVSGHNGTVVNNIYLTKWNEICYRLHGAYVAAADKTQIILDTNGTAQVYWQEGA